MANLVKKLNIAVRESVSSSCVREFGLVEKVTQPHRAEEEKRPRR
jgi:hypothetical protein